MIPALMGIQAIALVFAGAGVGGVARYFLSLLLNPLVAALPMGTLVANVAGCGIAGGMLALVMARPVLDPSIRLLVITGFLGGLTTFSTFSLEVLWMLESKQPMLAAGTIALHVGLSLFAALLAFWAMRALLA
ncbi:MAG: fluoride efflux transporter CrcB [Pseudomonadota bacterium]